ncbi:hypothetical protein EUV02_02200 [Polymorphobacter arshaanensis]|uniref:HTH crp-type domain-containing protein n=1 Tax=Glacieibacterium arshaanense TaxID=2511025 RepID=A0A4Y9ESI1_9SPHN|nr:hypothetical protein [Polymorphobacter arshaanensis]TFU05858.1 hypothetical protein EUV02_02200 [Polymorphobacter arshaanensis]
MTTGPHVTVEPEQLVAERRTTAYATLNTFLAQHAIMSETFGMRPAKLLVYLVIVTATVQRLMRAPELSGPVRGDVRLPRSDIGYISRRAIAAATGLPRENVRRIVNELLAEDLLLVGPRGGLANRGGLLENPRIVTGLQAIIAEQARALQRLCDSGVVAVIAH